LLSGKMPPEKAREVAHRLATGTWTHDFPITVETAKELIGLPISTEIPGEVFLVTSLYPQAQQSQPPVFYLPGTAIQERRTSWTRNRAALILAHSLADAIYIAYVVQGISLDTISAAV
jgi:hypothetical protein